MEVEPAKRRPSGTTKAPLPGQHQAPVRPVINWFDWRRLLALATWHFAQTAAPLRSPIGQEPPLRSGPARSRRRPKLLGGRAKGGRQISGPKEPGGALFAVV